MKQPVIQLHDLSAGYRRHRQPPLPVVSGITTELHAGELVCLIGPNGAGKSTLLRTVSGMQPRLGGRVTLLGQDLHSMSADQRARHLSIVLTQKMDIGLFTGYGLVAMGRQPYTSWIGRLTANDHKIIKHAITAVGAEHLAECRFHEMSDGERQKIMIARALAQEPDAMILDEPTAYLDLPRRVECMTLLRDLAHDQGCAVLLATHDLDLALRWADRIWLLPYRGAFQVGTPEDLVLNGAFEQAFRSAGVQFDDATGTFHTGRQIIDRSIVLEGDGTQYFWTQRALEREGFRVETVRRTGLPVVRVRQTEAAYSWSLDDDGSTTHLTLGSLIARLKRERTAESHTAV
jgi:iron complex transport system ATP-binding protein